MHWNMTQQFVHRMVLLIGCSSILMFGGKATANPVIVVSAISPPILAAMSSANYHCINIIYDKNGNRISQADVAVTTTSITWGSGTYGCFTWSQ